jgi:hypothetical protein
VATLTPREARSWSAPLCSDVLSGKGKCTFAPIQEEKAILHETVSLFPRSGGHLIAIQTQGVRMDYPPVSQTGSYSFPRR